MLKAMWIGTLGLSLCWVCGCGRAESDKGTSTPTISTPAPKDGIPQPIPVAPVGGGEAPKGPATIAN